MTVISKFTKITAWKQREEVEALGDLSGMTADEPISTVISGRPAVVHSWFDEKTGNGFEQRDITLHSFEV